MKQQLISSFSMFILFLHCANTFAQIPAAAPAQAPAVVVASPPAATPTQAAAPHGITNVTKILEKAGHFTIFIRLLRSTQEENHLFSALNDSSTGLTIFAPTDSAFSELKSGTLNTLSDGDKSELVKFHVVPTFLSTSQFQTVSNPLGTCMGRNSKILKKSRPSLQFVESNEKMKAVVITTPGGPEVLQLQEVEDPQIKEDEVLVKVEATALNRADTLQRQGKYPPPTGASSYPGLECSGTIEAVGKNVSRWKIGDQVIHFKFPKEPNSSKSGAFASFDKRLNFEFKKVCALLSGGGYAEKVAVPAGQVLPVPQGVSLKDAASLPEVACTVWSTVFMMSRLSAGETFLVHGGSSGIGTFAIQIAKYKGVRVFVTAGSEDKLAVCKDLGADVCINYKNEDFVARVKEETDGKGVDVILDSIGAPYFQKNVDSLSIDGRLFLLGFMGGFVTQVNLASLFAKRITVQAAGLRTRSLENKAEIVSEVEKNVWPAIAAGKLKPVVYKYLPLSKAAEGHQLMESSKHAGKILLVT
ncbi:hypothetical protein DKX38_017041 [Salix brachista]|uniref:FAS1 domain-containing protein n=1 Tax=Salix brachista TaxID=2182728 RepID=A0A5N5KU33_9ROSI|nr:hypothetical protein DKX38_017041 [Salix brachista]